MDKIMNDNDNKTNHWLLIRSQLEMSLIKKLLSEPDYEMSGSDFDYETSLTDLAQKAQQEIISLKKQVESLKEQVASLTVPKYKTPVYRYVYEERLNPPSYIPSEEEIMLAKARYAFENEIWSTFHYLKMYIESLEGKEHTFPYTKESIEKQAKLSMKNWDKALEKWTDDNEVWDCFVSPEWFNTVYVNGLSDCHSGDCTGFACGCSRCHAENTFKIENTAKWGKSEGSKMENALMKDYQEKKALKEKELLNSKQNSTTNLEINK